MDKRLKDYMGFYLGQKILYPATGTIKTLSTTVLHTSRYKKVQLILRPISDMTPDEQAEHHRLLQDSIYTSKQEALRTAYLCSIGIDCFGLIDTGLAVDAKTIVNE